MSYVLQFDGGSRGNPGPSGWGWVLYDEQHTVLKENFGGCGHNTNNYAEYSGLLDGLRACSQMPGIDKLKIQGDSRLVIEHLNGKWRCKAPNLIPLYEECKTLLKSFPNKHIEWIPRGQNSYADALSNRGMDHQQNNS